MEEQAIHVWQELTGAQKAAVIALVKVDHKQTQIAFQLQIPPSTISDFIHHYQRHGFIANAPCSGRPRKTTKAQDLILVNTALANTHIPLTELHINTNSNLSNISIHQ